MAYILSIIVLAVVLLVIGIGALILIITKMKSTAGKVILSLITVFGLIGVFIVGLIVIGGFGLAQGAQNLAQEIQQDQKELATVYEVRNSNGEKKEVFEQNETVLGNGYEVKILSTTKFVDGTESEFLTDTEYCAAKVQITNKLNEKRSVSTLSMNFLDANNTVLTPGIVYFDEKNQTEYESKTVELDPQQTAVIPVATECADKPIRLDGDNTDYTIRFNVAF